MRDHGTDIDWTQIYPELEKMWGDGNPCPTLLVGVSTGYMRIQEHRADTLNGYQGERKKKGSWCKVGGGKYKWGPPPGMRVRHDLLYHDPQLCLRGREEQHAYYPVRITHGFIIINDTKAFLVMNVRNSWFPTKSLWAFPGTWKSPVSSLFCCLVGTIWLGSDQLIKVQCHFHLGPGASPIITQILLSQPWHQMWRTLRATWW